MNAPHLTKEALRPLLSDDGFSDNNFDAIEDVCLRHLQHATAAGPTTALCDAGIYLLLKLVGDIRAIWDEEQPLMENRRDALKAGIWEPFQQFADAVLTDSPPDQLLTVFQRALAAVVVFS